MTTRYKPSGSTSHDTVEEVKEYFEDEKTLKQHVKEVAKLLNNSSHTTVYTGAGISTAAKIPDYRGPNGAWTLRDIGKVPKGIEIDQAFPTYSHYALVELMKKKKIHHVCSTNIDGLHRRSGLNSEELSELHGNCYKEYCVDCKKEYLRYFDVTKTVTDYRNHITGRLCKDCKGLLKDTIIHFSETLPKDELQKSVSHAYKSEVSLVLGTSMRVHPACDIPFYNKNVKLVIVNLQKTPFDDKSKVRIFAKTDDFMKLLMEELNLTEFDTTFDANSKMDKSEINMEEEEEIQNKLKDYINENKIPSKYSKFDLEREIKGDTGFTVSISDCCEHVDENFGEMLDLREKMNAECEECGNKGENWMCLKCGKVCCSRYIKGHMKDHNLESGHELAVSFVDLSFWCYKCEDYINNPHIGLRSFRRILEELKFPSDDPNYEQNISQAISQLFSNK